MEDRKNGEIALTDEQLTRLAVEQILEDTKRAARRAETVGAFGWQPSHKSINKQFLNNTLLANAQHNKRKDRMKTEKNDS